MEELLFRAELRPNASAGPRAVAALAWLLGGLALGWAGVLLALGAWLVLPFVAAAFGLAGVMLVRQRQALVRQRELLELTRREFRLTRTGPDGRVWRLVLEPYWLQLEHTAPPPRLWVRTHGRRYRIGSPLPAAELRELGEALSGALARWRARSQDTDGGT